MKLDKNLKKNKIIKKVEKIKGRKKIKKTKMTVKQDFEKKLIKKEKGVEIYGIIRTFEFPNGMKARESFYWRYLVKIGKEEKEFTSIEGVKGYLRCLGKEIDF